MSTVDAYDRLNTGPVDDCCDTTDAPADGVAQSDKLRWRWAARWSQKLAWISLTLVVAEGAVGVWQGTVAGSVALIAWALGGAPEALGSLAVIWRFSGARALSPAADRRAQRGVALSFWLSSPYLAAESVHHLLTEHEPRPSAIAIAVTAVALLQMPVLGWAQRRLGSLLGSAAAVSKGTQSYLCAAQAAAVFGGLIVTSRWPSAWWLDAAIGLGIAGAGVWQGVRVWRGRGCGC